MKENENHDHDKKKLEWNKQMILCCVDEEEDVNSSHSQA